MCDSNLCIITAGNMIKKMNQSVHPCQDFYQFACGNFLANTPMPSGHTRWALFSEIANKNNFVIKKAVESYKSLQSQASHTVLPAITKVINMYQSCMNLTIIDQYGGQPLIQLMKKLQPWKLSSDRDWIADHWDFNQALIESHFLGGGGLFLIYANTDPGNSSRIILQAAQAGTGLSSRHYYLSNSSLLGNYKVYMMDIFKLLNVKQSAGNISQIVEKVVELEIELAQQFLPAEEMMPDQTYHFNAVEDLITMCPVIPWIKLISNLTSAAVVNKTVINIATPRYFQHLSHIISKTEKSIMSTYLMWRIINSMVDTLSKPFRDANRKFNLAFNGGDPSAIKPRWETCIDKLNYYFGKATGRLFVDSHFQGKSKDQAMKMIAGIREAFLNNLPTVKWMDPKTAAKANEKARAIISLIGFPDWILNNEKLNAYYSGVIINPNEFFKNTINLRIFLNNKGMALLKTPVDRHRWFMEPSTVNAYFSQSLNDIVFPAGILQEPFFHKNYPKYLNYGGIGVAMGHELTHGFDSSGLKFDSVGNLKSWWEDEANTAYEQHAKCMIDQYARYKIDNINLNGNLTITENIADNGGMKLAYNAYQKWKNDNEQEVQLPGLKYTPDQMLFIAFAQIWCTLETPQTTRHLILTNRHSPGKYRVIGTLSNSREFTKAFKCNAGTPMNPEKKCSVW
ncbi:uncharacterized protein TRIADDRAFT_37639 [Trichoplax adhaerens]|uniref:Endothelin-converting enzyme 1 n=1 Tax=Trichoplax adhaerens TaxID=10228 RepID=B3RTH7_TRIAD|nr:hypothetical protein TRIADDRAFT_37639 [Trichoplax adhaerens]EDV26135.1 hypothetical protein TRIADDRAFT_37639 [Trichoplax adhaerens]|eukprot:XP_002112168.1 hypothetical protein TRIADDRAFT_37639 [Trichoplax adhaerens]